MRYTGERLRSLLNGNSGLRKQVYASLNTGGKKKGIEYFYGNDLNITLKKLSAIMHATKKPIEFFVDFEDGERIMDGRVSGTGNVVNSTIVNNDDEVNHMKEILKLKEELLNEKERIIALKDGQIEYQNKRYDELLALIKSDTVGPF
ncbi:MAG: hypothetical protein IKK81_07165 [Prevotella sp.]|nr:hypothetical protein [Prevotella sp.]